VDAVGRVQLEAGFAGCLVDLFFVDERRAELDARAVVLLLAFVLVVAVFAILDL